MKAKRIFILFFSSLSLMSFSQKEKEKDNNWNYTPNFIVGVDVVNAGISFFSDRKVYQGFISSEIKKDTHAVIDAGFEKNIYQKNGYDASVSGPFVKIGGFYMLIKDVENEYNGFYGGGKLGATFFQQEYFAIPVKGYNGNNSTVALPKTGQSAYWIEGNLGGRIQLFSTNFYADVNVQPKYLLFATKQDEVVPLIVPGFGKSSGKFNIGFSWNIAYQF
jgi:hypothetical protein